MEEELLAPLGPQRGAALLGDLGAVVAAARATR